MKRIGVATIVGVATAINPISPAAAESGSKNCTGDGQVAIVMTSSQHSGGTVQVHNGPPLGGNTWERHVKTRTGAVYPTNYGFASPLTEGRWGASAARDRQDFFTAAAWCTKGGITSWPVKKTRSLAGRTCGVGENVLIWAQGFYRIILNYTRNGNERHLVMGTTSGLSDVTFNVGDTGFRSIDSVRIDVRAPSDARADTWLAGAYTTCSSGYTGGD